MSKLPRYLRRIETFYNPVSDIFGHSSDTSDSSEDTEESDIEHAPILPVTMGCTPADVETLLRKFNGSRVKLNALEPSVFCGSINENARDWLKKFNNYTTLNKYDEKEKIIIFESLLTKTAQHWFDNLTDQAKQTWTDIEKQFQEDYYKNSTWINDQRLENRKLRPGESCTSYMNSILDLGQLVDMDQRELRKAIIRGLPDRLKYQVVSHNPQTLDDTVQRVLLCESLMTPDEQSINTLEDRVTSTKMNDFVTKLSTSLDEIEKTFDRFRHTADQLNTSAVPIMNLPTCRVCGRTNHREDNCYFRQYRSNRQFRPNQPYRGHGNPYRGTFQRQNSYNHGYNQPGYTTPYNSRQQPNVQRPYYNQTRTPLQMSSYNTAGRQMQPSYSDRRMQQEQSKNGVGPQS